MKAVNSWLSQKHNNLEDFDRKQRNSFPCWYFRKSCVNRFAETWPRGRCDDAEVISSAAENDTKWCSVQEASRSTDNPGAANGVILHRSRSYFNFG